MFLTTERVAVNDDKGNTIWIRGKMDMATKQRVIGAATTVKMVAGKGGDGEQGEAGVNPGNYVMALLTYNILSWEGPAFDGVACTPANIGRLDPQEPLVNQVIAELNRRNRQAATDPK